MTANKNRDIITLINEVKTLIKLYLADISVLGDPQSDNSKISLLPQERQIKILKHKLADDRRRSLGAGMIINKILYENNVDVNSIHYGSNGKPYADNIFFNVAHSGKFAFGISSDKEIGCDVEIIKNAHLDIAKRVFTESEYNYISKSENSSNTFYKLWTIKESYIKLSGEGLRTPLNSFEINISDNDISITENNIAKDCFVTQFEFDNHSFAICSYEQPPRKIEFNYV